MDTSILTTTNDQVKAAISILAAAEAEVRRLEELQIAQFAQEKRLTDELTQLESEMGSRVLAGIEAGKDVSGKVGAEIESKRLSLEMAKAVSLALVPKLATARKEVITSKAVVLRAEADRLQHEAERRQVIAAAMLADLVDFEGANYAPAAYSEGISMRGGYGDPRGPVNRLPFTALLFNRAAGLRGNADAIEARRNMPAELVTGALLAPFEIDYAAGRVVTPEPVQYDLKDPFKGGKGPELLDMVPTYQGGGVGEVAAWNKVSGPSGVLDSRPASVPGLD